MPAEVEDKLKKLRDDVNFLGECLGEHLREQEGEVFFQKIEDIRLLSKKSRETSKDDFAGVFHEQLDQLSPLELKKIARAFSHFLVLSNLAEDVHRVRRRRFHESKGRVQKASFAETIDLLLEQGVARDEIIFFFHDFVSEFVLTAHPTQVFRRSSLGKQNNIYKLLLAKDKSFLTPGEKISIQEKLKSEILGLWLSEEVSHEKITPLEEARSGLLVVQNSLWDALPAMLRNLNTVLEEKLNASLSPNVSPIKMSSWMGGDRDGNPFVTAAMTQDICYMARLMGGELFLAELKKLWKELSFCVASSDLLKEGDKNPYRSILEKWISLIQKENNALKVYLQAEGPKQNLELLNSEDLYTDLSSIYNDLCKTGVKRIADQSLRDNLWRLKSMGLGLVKLDIRQESVEHTKCVSAIFDHEKWAQYLDLSEKEKCDFLWEKINSAPMQNSFQAHSEIAEYITLFKSFSKNSSLFFNCYVISMTKQLSHILEVYFLQKYFGWKDVLAVVPLFETGDDLEAAPEVLNKFFEMKGAKNFIQNKMQIMLGYSDSAKDVGRVSAAWGLYKAQEKIINLCKKQEIICTLFHGRGASIARGGGPTYMALQAQPPGSITKSLRVTEQGEAIQAKFGRNEIAQRTMELYLTGSLLHKFSRKTEVKAEWRELLDSLAEHSKESYCSYVKEDPNFLPYFKEVTPVGELPLLNIGSRPAKRKKSAGWSSLRAIPWIFSWSQNRSLVPSWWGVQKGLEQSVEKFGLDLHREMSEDWTFFRSLLGLIEMLLSKVDLNVFAQYENELVSASLKGEQKILKNYEMAVAQVLKVTGDQKLLDKNPVLQRAIPIRNIYLEPLHLIQIQCLGRIRKGDKDKLLKEAFVVSSQGIATGLRNAG